MPDVYLITGAGSGFGALAARALAKVGYTVYAGLHANDGKLGPADDDAKAFAKGHHVDLRTVSLDLLKQDSCNDAVSTILKATGKIDAVVHNAGHMNYGPGEAFTPEQYLALYDVNVVGAQRLNLAVLPHMRARRSGHLIWISSTSVYGAKGPWLGGYFAAKAAGDTLAQSYSRELNPWGIETTIVSPGAFTKGTNHFANAMQPARPDIAREYDEGPTKGVSEQNLKGTADNIPADADPTIVADALVELAAMPRGKKAYRMTCDPSETGHRESAIITDRFGADFVKQIGLERLLKVSLW